MRYKVFILLGLFLLGVVGATETQVSFRIGGCSFPDGEGEYVDVPSGTCSIGEFKGLFYCSDDNDEYFTNLPSKGCSRGQDAIPSGIPLCCPVGFFCNQTATATFQCQSSTELCASQATEGDCEDISTTCVWLDELETPSCVGTASDYSCEYYQSPSTCGTDELQLGRIGV
jgi:hypothetical protein